MGLEGGDGCKCMCFFGFVFVFFGFLFCFILFHFRATNYCDDHRDDQRRQRFFTMTYLPRYGGDGCISFVLFSLSFYYDEDDDCDDDTILCNDLFYRAMKNQFFHISITITSYPSPAPSKYCYSYLLYLSFSLTLNVTKMLTPFCV